MACRNSVNRMEIKAELTLELKILIFIYVFFSIYFVSRPKIQILFSLNICLVNKCTEKKKTRRIFNIDIKCKTV